MNDLTAEEMQLVLELRRRRDRDKQQWKPRGLDEYTSEQKVAAFDEMHRLAMSIYNDIKELQCDSLDNSEFAFEAVVDLLGYPGDSVTHELNKLKS